jgi:hypothetical protein
MGLIQFRRKDKDRVVTNSQGLQMDFTIGEFLCPCGVDHENFILREHVEKLQHLRRLLFEDYGHEVYIKVTSGYRCEAHNKVVKGKKDSQHLKGLATDIKPYCMSGGRKVFLNPSYVKQIADKIGFGFVLQEPTWVHVDSRS